ncbi:hypothetical protein I4U23_005039 [Adineta vaga]|nr:hypothetical protein I4U23_005039 [Adineta vaga]
MIPRDKRLLANEHVPFIITNEIDLNSRFGRLISAILLYQGFEKSYRIINEKWQLANCIFISDSIHLNFNQILVSLAMSIIQCEYDRHSREFLLSKRLIMEITRITKNRNNTTNDDWFYLLIQSLYEYIDSKFWKSFPWCGYTKKPKQRHKLQKIINNLCSLSTVKVQKNKEIYHEVRLLRLQRLAKLQFSTADAKENRTRSKR